MTKAVFLDRDGVINDGSLYYTYKVEDFKFNPGVFDGLKVLQNAGFLLIVVSNQSGVAKGLYTKDDVEAVHKYMCEQLQKEGIEIAGVYYCPHHPDVSGPCECRKPGTKMIDDAVERFSIDRSRSFLIGDGFRDVEAARRAGIQGVKIEKNESILPSCQKIVEVDKYYIEINHLR